jgi:AcrR family transcriptional regulator
MAQVKKAPRSSADAVKEALVDAVIALLARRSAADISVRDIAKKARVNHGLVHRHFGSKDALVREAVRRTSAMINEARPTPPQMLWSHALFRERPDLAHVVARCCLDGPRDVLKLAALPRKARKAIHRSIEEALERMGIPGVDAPTLNAFFVAGLLGWIVFRPLLDASFDLPRDADERLAKIATLVDSLLA